MSVEQSNTVSLPLTGLPLTGLPLTGLPLSGLPLTGSPSFTPVWIPGNFPYLTTFLHGRPKHDRDEFSFKHPQMDHGKRAKIFAPFDALDGYSDAVKSKDVEYVQKIDLTEDTLAEEEREELSRKLEILHRLTYHGSLARKNHVRISVKYFVPCTDENSFAYGVRGLYRVVSGICWRVDPIGQTITIGETVMVGMVAGLTAGGQTVMVGKVVIPFRDIVGIDNAGQGVFKVEWAVETP